MQPTVAETVDGDGQCPALRIGRGWRTQGGVQVQPVATADLLRKQSAMRNKNSGDFGRVQRTVPVEHKVESGLAHGDVIGGTTQYRHPQRPQPLAGDGDVGLPSLHGNRVRRKRRQGGQDLTTTGIHVKHSPRRRKQRQGSLGVHPRRISTVHSAAQPAKVPSADGRLEGLLNEYVIAQHLVTVLRMGNMGYPIIHRQSDQAVRFPTRVGLSQLKLVRGQKPGDPAGLSVAPARSAQRAPTGP